MWIHFVGQPHTWLLRSSKNRFTTIRWMYGLWGCCSSGCCSEIFHSKVLTWNFKSILSVLKASTSGKWSWGIILTMGRRYLIFWLKFSTKFSGLILRKGFLLRNCRNIRSFRLLKVWHRFLPRAKVLIRRPHLSRRRYRLLRLSWSRLKRWNFWRSGNIYVWTTTSRRYLLLWLSLTAATSGTGRDTTKWRQVWINWVITWWRTWRKIT